MSTNLLSEYEMEEAARHMARGNSRRGTTEMFLNRDDIQQSLDEKGLTQIEARRLINRQIRFADKSSPEFRPTKYSGIWEIEREAMVDATRDKLYETVNGLVETLQEAQAERRSVREKLQTQLNEYLEAAICPTETDEALRLVSAIGKLQDGEIASQVQLVKLLQQIGGTEEGTDNGQMALPPLSA